MIIICLLIPSECFGFKGPAELFWFTSTWEAAVLRKTGAKRKQSYLLASSNSGSRYFLEEFVCIRVCVFVLVSYT